jgi:hypothetical protein
MRAHDGLPFRPFSIQNPKRDRSTLGQAVSDAAGKGHLIGFKLHSRPTPVSKPASRKISLDVLNQDGNTGGKALEDTNEFGSM